MLYNRKIPQKVHDVHSDYQCTQWTKKLYPKYIKKLTLRRYFFERAETNTQKFRFPKIIRNIRGVLSRNQLLLFQRFSRYLETLNTQGQADALLKRFPNKKDVILNINKRENWKTLFSKRRLVTLHLSSEYITKKGRRSRDKKNTKCNPNFLQGQSYSPRLKRVIKNMKGLREINIIGPLNEGFLQICLLIKDHLEILDQVKISMKVLKEKRSTIQFLPKEIFPKLRAFDLETNYVTTFSPFSEYYNHFRELEFLRLYLFFYNIGSYDLSGLESLQNLSKLKVIELTCSSLDTKTTRELFFHFSLPKQIKQVKLCWEELSRYDYNYLPIDISSKEIENFISRWEGLDHLKELDVEIDYTGVPGSLCLEMFIRIMQKLKNIKYLNYKTMFIGEEIGHERFREANAIELNQVLNYINPFLSEVRQVHLGLPLISITELNSEINIDAPSLNSIEIGSRLNGIENLDNLVTTIKRLRNTNSKGRDYYILDLIIGEIGIQEVTDIKIILDKLRKMKGVAVEVTLDLCSINEEAICSVISDYVHQLEEEYDLYLRLKVTFMQESTWKEIRQALISTEKISDLTVKQQDGPYYRYRKGEQEQVNDNPNNGLLFSDDSLEIDSSDFEI